MTISFENQVCVITGAGSGIGFACARLMAESGAKVAVIGRNEKKIRLAAEQLSEYGSVTAYPMDVSKTETIADMVELIRRELGEIRYLIQAAGIMDGKPGVEITPADWDRVMDTNAKGLFFMMQACVKQSMLAHGGAIVNISSMAGIRGMRPPMCSAHYSASKGAVAALTMQAAVEWASAGVRVNGIVPGGVASFLTGIHLDEDKRPKPDFGEKGAPVLEGVPSGRLSKPEEIAAMAAFLLSDYSANTTGHLAVIDGGSSVVGY